jgi:hypothetical protein
MLVRPIRCTDEHLDEVVEPCGRVVLDGRRAHHEVAFVVLVPHPQVPVILDPCRVEVRQVPAVVDDPLRVRVGEPDAGQRRELERRLTVGYAAELEIHRPGMLCVYVPTPRS